MAQDIYGSSTKLGGVFKGTTVALTLGDARGQGAGKGALIQNVSISYTRNVNRIWELGSDDTYFIIGHSEGQAQLAQIHAKMDADILSRLGDACEALTKTLVLDGRTSMCEDDATFKVTMTGPVLTNRTISIDAGQFVVNKSAAIMFTGLTQSA